jgi:hypothetical protein
VRARVCAGVCDRKRALSSLGHGHGHATRLGQQRQPVPTRTRTLRRCCRGRAGLGVCVGARTSAARTSTGTGPAADTASSVVGSRSSGRGCARTAAAGGSVPAGRASASARGRAGAGSQATASTPTGGSCGSADARSGTGPRYIVRGTASSGTGAAAGPWACAGARAAPTGACDETCGVGIGVGAACARAQLCRGDDDGRRGGSGQLSCQERARGRARVDRSSHAGGAAVRKEGQTDTGARAGDVRVCALVLVK